MPEPDQRAGSQLCEAGLQKGCLLYTSYETSDVLGTYIYRVGIQGGKFSQTAAIGLFATLINFVLVFAANTISNKLTNTGLW